jgi:hypothetical protein
LISGWREKVKDARKSSDTFKASPCLSDHDAMADEDNELAPPIKDSLQPKAKSIRVGVFSTTIEHL